MRSSATSSKCPNCGRKTVEVIVDTGSGKEYCGKCYSEKLVKEVGEMEPEFVECDCFDGDSELKILAANKDGKLCSKKGNLFLATHSHIKATTQNYVRYAPKLLPLLLDYEELGVVSCIYFTPDESRHFVIDIECRELEEI